VLTSCFRKLIRDPKVYFRGKLPNISRAPEPNDVIWENLNVPSLERLYRKAATYSATFGVLIICFFASYFLKLQKVNVQIKPIAKYG
jgi:hypothetical protein